MHPSKTIAIIGGGISGLSAAYLLSPQYNVHVFEQAAQLGGHANTKAVQLADETLAIDTGFIVCNDRNYPLFLKLLNRLGVSVQPTEMSFSVKHLASGLEYNGHNLNTLFAQRGNLFKPKFLRFVQQILQFNRKARQAAETLTDPHLTLKTFLHTQGFKPDSDLLTYYLLPMAAAIWSTSPHAVLDFPALFFIRFFKHHGLLALKNRPQWYSLPGGSRTYVQALQQQLEKPPFNTQIHLNRAVKHVRRYPSHITLVHKDHSGDDYEQNNYDHVIFACHSDQALALIEHPTPAERDLLGCLPYTANQAILHTDAQLMPKQARAWASWNYCLTSHQTQPIVTYNMRRLHNLRPHSTQAPPILVSLNAAHLINPDTILDIIDYAHPHFGATSLAAQAQWEHISGQHRSYFCGAYWFNGFHEDGVASALRVANQFGEFAF